MVGRLCSIAAAALMGAAMTGCGGPSAEETRADLKRWRTAVDTICRTTRERIADRGDAHDLRDLEDVAARASDDVSAAIVRIRRVPISERARPRVRRFLDELDKAEPLLRDMTRTTAGGELEQIGDLGGRLADETKRIQDRADAAGVRACADERQFDAVLDAFTAPVYATQIARFEAWLVREAAPLADYEAPTAAAFFRYLVRSERVADRAEKRLTDLYEHRPNRAVDAESNLREALGGYESLLEQYISTLRGGKRYLTQAGYEQFDRASARYGREVRRAFAALRKAIGADPLPEPGAEPPAQPDDDPA